MEPPLDEDTSMNEPNIPRRMTAVEITRPGGPEVLVPTLRPTPVPGPRELLIRVFAAGVNGPDVLQRRGLYDPPAGASDILRAWKFPAKWWPLAAKPAFSPPATRSAP